MAKPIVVCQITWTAIPKKAPEGAIHTDTEIKLKGDLKSVEYVALMKKFSTDKQNKKSDKFITKLNTLLVNELLQNVGVLKLENIKTKVKTPKFKK